MPRKTRLLSCRRRWVRGGVTVGGNLEIGLWAAVMSVPEGDCEVRTMGECDVKTLGDCHGRAKREV